MRKDEVQISYHNGHRCAPMINIKMYGENAPKLPSTSDVMARFACSETQAENALEFATRQACEMFWEDYQSSGSQIKINGCSVKVWSAGRCGGWLVVCGLPEVKSWDAIMLGAWARFRSDVIRTMRAYLSTEALMDYIDSNEWWKDGAEQYNFIDGNGGEPKCIADMKAAAIKAGFGPVVRK